jgi:hypothetical protein
MENNVGNTYLDKIEESFYKKKTFKILAFNFRDYGVLTDNHFSANWQRKNIISLDEALLF